MKIFTVLSANLRKLLDYLNDSGDLTTGSHRGTARCCSLYSGLSPMDGEQRRS